MKKYSLEYIEHHKLANSSILTKHSNIGVKFNGDFIKILDDSPTIYKFLDNFYFFIPTKGGSSCELKYPVRSILSFFASELSPGTINIEKWELSLSLEEKKAIAKNIKWGDENEVEKIEKGDFLLYITKVFDFPFRIKDPIGLSASQKNNFSLCISHGIRCIHIEGYKIRGLNFDHIGYDEATGNYFIYYLRTPSGVKDDSATNTLVNSPETRFMNTFSQDVFDFGRLLYSLYLNKEIGRRETEQFPKKKPEEMTQRLFDLLNSIFSSSEYNTVPTSFQIFQWICDGQLFEDPQSLDDYNVRVAEIKKSDIIIQQNQNITVTIKKFNEIQSTNFDQRLKSHAKIAYGIKCGSFEDLCYGVMIFENGCGGVSKDPVRALILRDKIEKLYGYSLRPEQLELRLREAFELEADARIKIKSLPLIKDQDKVEKLLAEIRNELERALGIYLKSVKAGSNARKLLSKEEWSSDDYEIYSTLATQFGLITPKMPSTFPCKKSADVALILRMITLDSGEALGRIGPIVLLLDPNARDKAEDILRKAIRNDGLDMLHTLVEAGMPGTHGQMPIEEAVCIKAGSLEPLRMRARQKPPVDSEMEEKTMYEAAVNIYDAVLCAMRTYPRLRLARLLASKEGLVDACLNPKAPQTSEGVKSLLAGKRPPQVAAVEEIAELYEGCITSNFLESRTAEYAHDFYMIAEREYARLASILLESNKDAARFALECAEDDLNRARKAIKIAVQIDDVFLRPQAYAKSKSDMLDYIMEIRNSIYQGKK